jgi:predicted permease
MRLFDVPASLLRDVREALRALLARPGYALACVLTLGLGLGANLAIFAMFRGMLLQPVPSPNMERLVQVWDASNQQRGEGGMSVADYVERKDAASFDGLALLHRVNLNLAHGDEVERIEARRTTGNLFGVLGVQPMLGRVWSAEQELPGHDHVIVLGHDLWQRRFGADPDIVGREVRIDGQSWTVIGVMPEGFYYSSRSAEAYVPFAFAADEFSDERRGSVYAVTVGLLKPGVTAAMATREMQGLLDARAASDPAWRERFERNGVHAKVDRLLDIQFRQIGAAVVAAQVAVTLVLLVAIANLTGLTLSHWLAQRRAFAVRAALGASRWRLLRRVFSESLWLALGGCAVAVVIGAGLLHGLRLLIGPVAARMPSFGVDGDVVGWTLLLAVGAAFLATLAPALATSAPQPTADLRAQGAGNSESRGAGRLRQILVVLQMGVAMMLITAAILLTRSLGAILTVPPGIETANVLTARLSLPEATYPDDAARLDLMDRLKQRLSALPGVVAADFTQIVPFSNSDWTTSYAIAGQPPLEETPYAHARIVGPDYFDVLAMRMIEGRRFGRGDRADAVRVAVVDQKFADMHFPGRSAIGERIEGVDDAGPVTIVGVVNTARFVSRDRDPQFGSIYFPMAQRVPREFGVLLRTAVDPLALGTALGRELRAIDSGLPAYDVLSLDQRVDADLVDRRGISVTLQVFALAAVLLTAIGLFGALALSVARRQAEFGVRKALGATAASLQRAVVGQGLKLAVVGLGFGLLAALGLMRLLRSVLLEVSPYDPSSYLAALTLLVATALLASWWPARRAARVQPVQALRGE